PFIRWSGKSLLKKQEITTLHCRARPPALRLVGRSQESQEQASSFRCQVLWAQRGFRSPYSGHRMKEPKTEVRSQKSEARTSKPGGPRCPLLGQRVRERAGNLSVHQAPAALGNLAGGSGWRRELSGVQLLFGLDAAHELPEPRLRGPNRHDQQRERDGLLVSGQCELLFRPHGQLRLRRREPPERGLHPFRFPVRHLGLERLQLGV